MTTCRRRSGLWAWLLVCLVVAQSLGLMHSIVHGAHAHRAPDAWDVASQPWQEQSSGKGWLAQLFAAHGHGSDCRLYDQSSHGDCMPAVLPADVAPPTAPDRVQAFEAAAPLVAAALVRARGPPSLR